MKPESEPNSEQVTLQQLIDTISFANKRDKDCSNKSVSGSSASDSWFEGTNKKYKSKTWTQQENALFWQLIEKYGTDFTLIKEFFPKKSKNQIKRKYKTDAKGVGWPKAGVAHEKREKMPQKQVRVEEVKENGAKETSAEQKAEKEARELH